MRNEPVTQTRRTNGPSWSVRLPAALRSAGPAVFLGLPSTRTTRLLIPRRSQPWRCHRQGAHRPSGRKTTSMDQKRFGTDSNDITVCELMGAKVAITAHVENPVQERNVQICSLTTRHWERRVVAPATTKETRGMNNTRQSWNNIFAQRKCRHRQKRPSVPSSRARTFWNVTP